MAAHRRHCFQGSPHGTTLPKIRQTHKFQVSDRGEAPKYRIHWATARIQFDDQVLLHKPLPPQEETDSGGDGGDKPAVPDYWSLRAAVGSDAKSPESQQSSGPRLR